ncbi:hypothetical protein SASPL_125907 [Salvia splendens]|uniref:Uncharacterized protein n=1 Tax=Salvia splendens TaxID=180675 RepID=A0A8X8XG98_SALSN|nr:hypothetical protein SASPL_125907 [Salvia splendens]
MLQTPLIRLLRSSRVGQKSQSQNPWTLHLNTYSDLLSRFFCLLFMLFSVATVCDYFQLFKLGGAYFRQTDFN